MITFHAILVDLDTLTKSIAAAAWDNTTDSQCRRLMTAADLLREAERLVREVAGES